MTLGNVAFKSMNIVYDPGQPMIINFFFYFREANLPIEAYTQFMNL